MEHETNGLVLIFLGETPACRQDGSLRLLSAAAQPTVYKIGNGPTWWMHLVLIYFKRLYLNRPSKRLCLRRPMCIDVIDCSHAL